MLFTKCYWFWIYIQYKCCFLANDESTLFWRASKWIHWFAVLCILTFLSRRIMQILNLLQYLVWKLSTSHRPRDSWFHPSSNWSVLLFTKCYLFQTIHIRLKLLLVLPFCRWRKHIIWKSRENEWLQLSICYFSYFNSFCPKSCKY